MTLKDKLLQKYIEQNNVDTKAKFEQLIIDAICKITVQELNQKLNMKNLPFENDKDNFVKISVNIKSNIIANFLFDKDKNDNYEELKTLYKVLYPDEDFNLKHLYDKLSLFFNDFKIELQRCQSEFKQPAITHNLSKATGFYFGNIRVWSYTARVDCEEGTKYEHVIDIKFYLQKPQN